MVVIAYLNILIGGLAAGGFVFMNWVVARALGTLAGSSYTETQQALLRPPPLT